MRGCEGGVRGGRKIQGPLGVLVSEGRGLLSPSLRSAWRGGNRNIRAGPVDFPRPVTFFTSLVWMLISASRLLVF